MTIPGFPDYGPVLQGLRDESNSSPQAAYKVCKEKGGRLCALSSLARKWLDYTGTGEEAKKLIDTHNLHFNPDGDFLEEDDRLG